MFQKKYKFKLTDKMCETPKGKTKTRTNQTYTIRELYEKYTTHGTANIKLLEPVNYDNASHDSLDLQKVQKMDIWDKQDVINNHRSTLQSLQEVINNAVEQQKEIEKQQEEEPAATSEIEEKATSEE